MKKIFSLIILSFLLISTVFAMNITVQSYTIRSAGQGGGSPGNVLLLPLGDSKTVGVGDNGAQTGGQFGYRDHLQSLLGVGVYKFVGAYTDPPSDPTFYVNHAGVDGDTTAQMITRLPGLLTTYMSGTISSSSYVVIDGGTNDCNNGTPIATITANIHSMASTVNTFNPNINVMIVLPNPTHVGTLTTCIGNMNISTKANILAYQSTKPNIHVYDEFNNFEANSNWEAQWLSNVGASHPNDAGYTVESQGIYNCMTNHNSQYCDGH